MPVFEYVALTEKGGQTTGIVDADTAKDAREKLRLRKIHVVKMNAVRDRAPASKSSSSGKGGASFSLKLPKIKRSYRDQVVAFTLQMATLLKAGIQLNDGLNALVGQATNKNVELVLRQVKEDISSGLTFADSLARHPHMFNDLYVNMIRAGEASGTLDAILERTGRFLQAQQRVKNKVAAALAYPALMSFIGFGVVIFLVSFVVPRILVVLEKQGNEEQALPVPTQILKASSDFVVQYWWAMLAVFVFSALSFYSFSKTEKGRFWIDSTKLKLPLFGDLFRKQVVSRFAITFSTLLNSGIPALQCLKILRDIVDNAVMARTIDEIHDRIVEGTDISTPLKKSGMFPPVVGYMIAIGEQTGQLENMLSNVSEVYEEEIEVTTQKLTAMIEPIIIVVMAGVVAFIVLAVILPLVQNFGKL